MSTLKPQLGLAGTAGLQFFGAVSATITHELRNALATINENAGLLSDFVAMAERGMRLDPDRLTTAVGRLTRHVGVAERLIQRMNRFAHSTDTLEQRVDVREVAHDVVTLCQRLIANRGREVHVEAGEAVMATTSPFLLSSLLWRCLDAAMAACGSPATIRVVVERRGDAAALRLGPFESLDALFHAGFPGAPERALGELLGCRVVADGARDELTIEMAERSLNEDRPPGSARDSWGGNHG